LPKPAWSRSPERSRRGVRESNGALWLELVHKRQFFAEDADPQGVDEAGVVFLKQPYDAEIVRPMPGN